MSDQNIVLSGFLEKAGKDERLLPSHISLFTAIYVLLKQTGSEFKVKVSRKKLMPMAKIQSISTYHRCMNDLSAFGYIVYQPSYDYFAGSIVTFPF